MSAAIPRGDQDRLSLELFGIGMALSVWLALGSASVIAFDGLGDHPWRRAVVGVLVSLAAIGGWVWQVPLWRALVRREWLILVLGGAQVVLAATDGLPGSPYFAFTLTTVGFAAVTTSPRMLWACVVLQTTLFATGVLVARTPSDLYRADELGAALGGLFAYPAGALILQTIGRLFGSWFVGMDDRLALLAGERSAVASPALGAALARVALPAGADPPEVPLSAREVEVVEGLVRHGKPAAIALELELSEATVRSHVQSAKRKTGARTLLQLAALTAHPAWPEVRL